MELRIRLSAIRQNFRGFFIQLFSLFTCHNIYRFIFLFVWRVKVNLGFIFLLNPNFLNNGSSPWSSILKSLTSGNSLKGLIFGFLVLLFHRIYLVCLTVCSQLVGYSVEILDAAVLIVGLHTLRNPLYVDDLLFLKFLLKSLSSFSSAVVSFLYSAY